MRKPRLLINVHVLLMLGVIGYALFSFSSLPEKYAAHFDMQGNVDRWAEKGNWEYWVVPAAAVAAGSLLLLALRYPRHFNYPQKEQVKRWPAWRRVPVYEKLGELLMIVAILVDVIFAAVLVAIVHSSGGEMNISCLGVLFATLAMPVVAIVYLVKISRLVERIESEMSVSGPLADVQNA